MASALTPSKLALLKRFNRSFPKFYEQFVSSAAQLENLQLAYRLYRSKEPVIEIKPDETRSSFEFAYRNQSFLLSDIFGILMAYGLTIHGVSLYGQVQAPMLVFIKLTISRNDQPLTQKITDNLHRAIREALSGRLEVEELLGVEFNFDEGLKAINTEFYIDPVFQLPTLVIEADEQVGLLYRVMYAVWQEDLLVVNANLVSWRGRIRLILYLFGPNESAIPEYLGKRIASSIRDRLSNGV